MKNVILVGTISSAANNLRSDLSKVTKAMSTFNLIKIFLVESDSTDLTVTILEELRTEIENFDFISLGHLKRDIPERVNRIRYCRNIYVSEIRNLSKTLKIDYVVVADLDGMNSKLSPEAFESSFTRDDWGAVLANQSGGYYDLLALRHPTWCPQDVIKDLKIEQSRIDKSPLPKLALIRRTRRRVAFDRARKKAIYSKMLVIKKSDNWIRVLSGFGGLGIYKTDVFMSFDYTISELDMGFESEHVALSKKIIESGQKIFINPCMINNHFNTYNINKFLVIRQIREIYWNSKARLKNSN
jgi:hypothetical protein